MAKNSITDYDTTAANNTDIGGIDIQGSANVANIDDGVRTLMKHIADLNTGASFIHDTYKIADSDAETRLAKFNAGSITAGQTRTFTFPDKDGTFAMADDVLALSGGTLTGFVTLHAAPTADLHAASKKYVDDNAATPASPVFTGNAEFENITDGTTAVDAEYIVNGAAKALCSFSGNGTVSIYSSLNVSSLTDRGTGLYTVNLSNAMSSDKHNVVITCDNWHAIQDQDDGADTTSSFGARTGNSSHSNADTGDIACCLHGDLA
jgi:hypothetical protein